MIELFLALLNGVARRVDGMRKDHWAKWALFNDRFMFKLSDVSAFLTRSIPFFSGVWLVGLTASGVWWAVLAVGVCFGFLIAVSLQRGYEDWTVISLRRLRHYELAFMGYFLISVLTWPIAYEFLISGFVCCLVAGLVPPTLARTGIGPYKEVSEVINGVLLFMPFVVVRLYA